MNDRRIRLGAILSLSAAVTLVGAEPEAPLTVLRTDSSEPLLTVPIPLLAPAAEASPVLRFEFGFSTDEPDAPATFFDSFSVTVRDDADADLALLLTADRTGVQWTPPNPGGLMIDPTRVEHAPAPFPDLEPDLGLDLAFVVAFVIPGALAGGPITLLLDLFSNLNQAASLAFVRDVRIESAAAVRLHSASAVTGPYQIESAAVHDEAARSFSLPAPSARRFYRVQAASTTRITGIRVAGAQVVITYRPEPGAGLRLLSAADVVGPYTVETQAVADTARRTFTVPRPQGPRFFRARGNLPTRLTGLRLAGEALVIDYAELPLVLQSAARVTGPFVDEPGAVLDPSSRAWRLARPSADRFYRVRSEVDSRLARIRVDGSDVVIEYELGP